MLLLLRSHHPHHTVTHTLRTIATADATTWGAQLHRTARAVAALLVLLYALSPLDLVPDALPGLGLLDDLVLVPAGLALVIRLVPRELWRACLHDAEHGDAGLPPLWWGSVVIVVVWLALLMAFVAWLGHQLWVVEIGRAHV